MADRPRHVGHVAHECGFLEDEVIGGKHRDGGLGIPRLDPVRRQEHARRGTPIMGLGEDMGPRRATELGLHEVGMAGQRHHHRALGRDEQTYPVQRLPEQGARAYHGCELLRTLVPVQMTGERAQAQAFPARENDGPEISLRRKLARSFDGIGAPGRTRSYAPPPHGIDIALPTRARDRTTEA